MNNKTQMRIEIKQISAEGSFEGILSAYNVVDLGKDVIVPGAFTKTILEHGNTVPMLWQHRTDEPIGTLTLIDGADALRVKGQLLMSLATATKAYLLIKAGIVRGLSIGYDTIKEVVEGTIRKLTEIRLWEGSVVTFPMCEQALITSVKANGKKDFSTELAEIQLQDAAYQMWIALRNALCSLPWSSLTREEKIAASEVCIQQFSESYMGFIGAYLDYLEESYGAMSAMTRADLEHKAGRAISAANMKQLKAAHEHVKAAGARSADAEDILFALLDDEAEEDDEGTKGAPVAGTTSEEKAAKTVEPEPEFLHSAAEVLELRKLIPAA
jgi:HK97 family phage prohead protease